MNSSACCDLFSLEIGLAFCFNACAEIDSKLLRNQNLKKKALKKKAFIKLFLNPNFEVP